jgi:hypothetical protein
MTPLVLYGRIKTDSPTTTHSGGGGPSSFFIIDSVISSENFDQFHFILNFEFLKLTIKLVS